MNPCLSGRIILQYFNIHSRGHRHPVSRCSFQMTSFSALIFAIFGELLMIYSLSLAVSRTEDTGCYFILSLRSYAIERFSESSRYLIRFPEGPTRAGLRTMNSGCYMLESMTRINCIHILYILNSFHSVLNLSFPVHHSRFIVQLNYTGYP